MTQTITFKDIQHLLPDETHMYYVDYRDSLDENLDILQECISKKEAFPLWEKVDEWFMDSPFHAKKEYDNQLASV